MTAFAAGERQSLPRSIRLVTALFGLISLIVGLAIGSYLLLGMGMSHGHGGSPIPDLRTLLLVFLPISLISIGIVGLICTTLRRFIVMCLLLVVFIAHITALASI